MVLEDVDYLFEQGGITGGVFSSRGQVVQPGHHRLLTRAGETKEAIVNTSSAQLARAAHTRSVATWYGWLYHIKATPASQPQFIRPDDPEAKKRCIVFGLFIMPCAGDTTYILHVHYFQYTP